MHKYEVFYGDHLFSSLEMFTNFPLSTKNHIFSHPYIHDLNIWPCFKWKLCCIFFHIWHFFLWLQRTFVFGAVCVCEIERQREKRDDENGLVCVWLSLVFIFYSIVCFFNLKIYLLMKCNIYLWVVKKQFCNLSLEMLLAIL